MAESCRSGHGLGLDRWGIIPFCSVRNPVFSTCLFRFKIRVDNERFFRPRVFREAVVYAFGLLSGFAGGFAGGLAAGFASGFVGVLVSAEGGFDSLAGAGLAGSAFFSGAAGLGAAGAAFSSSAPFFLDTLCPGGRFRFFT